jgi:hypothetical protein
MRRAFQAFLAGFVVCVAAGVAITEAVDVTDGGSGPGPEMVASLRERGPDGLAEALRTFDGIAKEHSRLMLSCSGSEFDQVERLGRDRDAWKAAIEMIGGQRSCAVSRLYWYTDLAKAKAAAAQSGRPILSLQMLGKLTDEFSCANSRFFRTALYANKEINDYLRDNFVLHWQSVRPVPRVTIDFGDGRKLERTVTGNSAHYALANDGTVLDVLPGLYSPRKFLSWLHSMRELDKSWVEAGKTADAASDRANVLRSYHQTRRAAVLREWDDDLKKLGEERAMLITSRTTLAMDSAALGRQAAQQPAPPANAAANRAATKTAVERPLLRFANVGGDWLEKGMDDEVWRAVADLHRAEVQLDERSIGLMREEFPAAPEAGQLAETKRRVEGPILRVVHTFEDSIGLDTVRNEYLLHRRVHELLGNNDSGTMEYGPLNEWVYAELFLTPSKDPWLGLAPDDVYSALDHGGRPAITGTRGGG